MLIPTVATQCRPFVPDMKTTPQLHVVSGVEQAQTKICFFAAPINSRQRSIIANLFKSRAAK
jgi:hypothetical protein